MDDVQEAVQEAIQDAIREVLQSETTSPDLGNAGHSQPETQELISELTDAKSNSNVKLSRKLALETLSKPPSGPPPDTLVFIDYPNTAKFSEFVGTTSPLRVHSVNLLATGSTEFRDLLSPTKNFRTIRRRKLVNQLPTGIIYVIDLTPPDEGDEAVNLTADLSLSLGIQQWYTMKKKARILNVGGSDESADSDLIPLLILKSSTRPRKTFGDPSGGKYSALKDHFRQSLLRPEASPPYSESLNAPRTLAESKSDLDTAVALSQTTEQNQGGFGSDEREVPEYSNIRHRLGIQRLLQVIEGKDPDLDSAPKVWTLCILAKYFDCTISVVDHISKWLLAEPNSLFIEVLPEMSAKIGLSLQTHAVTRAAFSVLVGEEALALICRRRSQLEPELPGATRFGRRKEDIDEDLKNRIEYASKAFEERISSTFEKFFNRNLDWLDQLPEFKKITQFQQAIDESREKGRFQWEQCVQTLRHFINSFIRRRILCALDASMVHTAFGKTFTDHRNLEALDLPSWMIGEPVFMYDQLTMPERVFTRPFWIQLRTMGFTLDSSYSGNHYLDRMGSEFARQEGIELVTHSGLITATRNFGEAVIEAISAGCLNGGQIPPEAIWNNTAKTDVEKEEDTVRNIKENVNSLKLVAEGWSDSQSPVPLVGSWDPTPKPESPTGNRGRMFIGGEFNSSDERSDVSPDNCSTRAIYNGIEENTTSRNRFAIHGYDTLAPNISADKPSVNFNNRLAIHELQPVAPEILVADPFANINNHMGLPNVPPPPPGLPMITHPTFTPSNPPISKLGMTVPESGFICEDSPFLNLSLLLSQVDDYISKLCQTMLSTNTMGFDINTTDVLLCLTDNEFRYLPVFAGGQDDGTGLVFTDPVPEATNGLAPIGPGPSFRTGFSMTDSSMGSVDGRSEFSYGADTETSSDLDQGSKIVEDGYSGIFPRMRMAVGSDVASVAWSGGEDTGTEVGFGDVLGKGKEVVKGKPGEIPTVFTPSSSVIGDDDNVTIAGDSNSDPIHGMRDVDMDNETVVDGDLDHDMTDTPMENMTTTTTASALTVMDADFSSYDYTYSYGYEENADEDEGDDQAEAEDDDNDITISDAGDVGVDDGDDREGKSEGKVDREGGEGSDDFRFDDGDLIAL